MKRLFAATNFDAVRPAVAILVVLFVGGWGGVRLVRSFAQFGARSK